MFSKECEEYRAIAGFYGDQTAQRSQVRLIDHIDQGIRVLEALGASEAAIKAFCLHPMFQSDADLPKAGALYARGAKDAYPVALAMEYRRVANAYLSARELPEGGVELSPLKEVNDMLIADKAQNRKDFERYHLATHPRSERLGRYFNEWLEALGVSEALYQRLTQAMEPGSKPPAP